MIRSMKVTAENDRLFLKRQDPKNADFIDAGANRSPFFIVLSTDDPSAYNEGDIVIPDFSHLIQVEIDGEERFFINENEILGVVSETD